MKKAKNTLCQCKVKLTVLSLAMLFVTADISVAYWEYVGSPGFISGYTTTNCLAFFDNTPYVVVGGSVLKFDGTDWVYVGSPDFANTGRPSLAFLDSIPHVSFPDSDHEGKMSVMRFNGAEWEYVGNPGFSDMGVWLYAIIAISLDDIYVAFIESNDYENRKISVMKFDGVNWNYVGPPRFSGIYTNWISLAVNEGVPYVTYLSTEGTQGLERIRKFNGLNWVDVGQVDFVDGRTEYNQIAFCNTSPYENTPYLAFNVNTFYDATRIMRYNGQVWVYIGAPFGQWHYEHSLAISGITPYVAFISSGGISVAKCEGNNWIDLGTNIVGGGGTMWPSLAVNNGIPYVAFSQGLVSVLRFRDEPLPVELSSISSIVKEGNVKLIWSTLSELNNAGFEIQRKSTNSNWTRIGFVNGAGSSQSHNEYEFADRILSSGTYSYRLKQIDFNGNFEYFELPESVTIGIPDKFFLAQNYPNPFNPRTTVAYGIPSADNVRLKVFDMTGREMMTIVNEFKEAGYYIAKFDASSLASGTYIYRIECGNFVSSMKMLLLK